MSIITVIENVMKEIEDYLSLMSKMPKNESEDLPGFGRLKDVSVVTANRNGRAYFYAQKKSGDRRKRKYLGTADTDIVKQIRDEQLKAALHDVLVNNREVLQSSIKTLKPYDLHALEQNISPCLRGISTEFVLNEDIRKLWDWGKSAYQRNNMPFPKRKIYAEDGTRVRSKGECMWFNEFIYQWVPMRYDPLMELENPKPGILGPGEYIWISPDFLIKCLDGEYIIVEHLGYLMDDKYANDFRNKLQIYLYNGFVPGVNLYILSDGADGGTDSQAIRQMVEQIRQRVYRGVI